LFHFKLKCSGRHKRAREENKEETNREKEALTKEK
jgi:hypothetical protein